MRSRNYCTFTAQKSKCPRCCWDIYPEISTRVLHAPAEPLTDFFFVANVGSLKAQISKKNTNKIWWENKKTLTVRQGHVKHVWKNSRSTYLSKTAWTWDTELIWSDKLELAYIRVQSNHAVIWLVHFSRTSKTRIFSYLDNITYVFSLLLRKTCTGTYVQTTNVSTWTYLSKAPLLPASETAPSPTLKMNGLPARPRAVTPKW